MVESFFNVYLEIFDGYLSMSYIGCFKCHGIAKLLKKKKLLYSKLFLPNYFFESKMAYLVFKHTDASGPLQSDDGRFDE